MRLLFDENLSPRLVARLAIDFPDSSHVELLRLRGASDDVLWDLARDSGFVLVSKDDDFRRRASVYGPPPQVVWLSIGNAGTDVVERLLRRARPEIEEFHRRGEKSVMVLRLEEG